MSLGPSGNAAVQGRKAKLDSDAEKRTNLALAEVMGTAAGRRVLWAIVNSSGVFGYSAAGAEPKRDFGVFLIDWFQTVSADLYLEMQAEAARETKAKNEIDQAIEQDEGNRDER